VPVAGNGVVFMKRSFILGITLALLGATAAAADLRAPPDVAAAPADASRAPSGLAWKVLTPGHGREHPGLNDRVKIAFTGWTADGKMFDAMPESKPAQFVLKNSLKGWNEGLQLMVKGEKRRFWIPSSLAYGETPRRPGMPAGPIGPVVFDVELLDYIKAPPPPTVPDDVAAPPKSAKKTASGIAYRVLEHGTGKDHPTADSTVEVHYTGWTTDGKMFDSSVTRGNPAKFRLRNVIAGWTEGVQLMVVGDRTRFWIPGSLAYGDTPTRPGAPAGALVFDIQLLAIK
jgi:FKBP-type peptidyl-prolyl cis-trans isomerase